MGRKYLDYRLGECSDAGRLCLESCREVDFVLRY